MMGVGFSVPFIVGERTSRYGERRRSDDVGGSTALEAGPLLVDL
jgi:hypothetical protein